VAIIAGSVAVHAGCTGRSIVRADAAGDDLSTRGAPDGSLDAFDASEASARDAIDTPPPRLPDVTIPPDTTDLPFHRVFRTATHNAYWIDRQDRPEVLASGVRERLLDQLLFHAVRSVEIDIHRDRDAAHVFRVFHTDSETNTLCTPFSECLAMLGAFHRLVPHHEALTVIVELKELQEPNFDEAHTPSDLDQAFVSEFGDVLYRPADFLARCDAASTMLDCARTAGWPTTRELRGRVMFAVIGNYRTNFTTAVCRLLHPTAPCLPSPADDVEGHGPLGWLTYATWGGGVRERAGFPMRSNWIHFNEAVDDEQAPAELVDAANAASVIWQVEDLSDPRVPDFIEANGLVRGADSFTMDAQRARVAAGFQFIQTDHPWFVLDDHAPGAPFRPLRSSWSFDATTLREPGHRFIVRGPDDETQSAFVPATFAVPDGTCVRWQTAVAITRAPTDASYPNASRPHGVGCLRAAASRADTSLDSISVCRSSNEHEFATVTFTPHIAGVDAPVTVLSHPSDTNGPGELLRLDVCGTATGTQVTAYSASAFGTDGMPRWTRVGDATSSARLAEQGLSATRDVLFVDTRRDGTNVSGAELGPIVVLRPSGITASSGARFVDDSVE
jgi:hypothetical protein